MRNLLRNSSSRNLVYPPLGKHTIDACCQFHFFQHRDYKAKASSCQARSQAELCLPEFGFPMITGKRIWPENSIKPTRGKIRVNPASSSFRKVIALSVATIKWRGIKPSVAEFFRRDSNPGRDGIVEKGQVHLVQSTLWAFPLNVPDPFITKPTFIRWAKAKGAFLQDF